MSTQPIITYLNDHFGGSVAAIQLLDHLVESSESTEEKQLFTSLREEIAEDQQALEDLIRAQGGSPSPLRQVGGWIAEKVGRLKLTFDDPGHGPLARLQSLEVLALGITGKLALWDALGAASASVTALAGLDLPRLQKRAMEQRDKVEALRLQTARHALGAPA